MRCVLEARNHEHNCFITLTYNDEHLPEDRSLDRQHLTKFFKRLRKHRGPFRYYACGEYGDLTKRAHYHACLFGLDFADKIQFERKGDHTLYLSQQLTDIWGHGHCTVAELNFETAAYCARYVLKKKLTVARQQQLHHALLDEETGELHQVQHPYATMSLRKAIAKEWMERYSGDIYNADKDFLVLRNKKMKPPKYFDAIYDTIDSQKLKRIKEKRKENRTELSLQELRAHEKITRARIIQRKQI
jgi:hypothetical protein